MNGASEPRWSRIELILLMAGIGVLLWLAGDVLMLVFAGLLLAVGVDGLATAIAARTPLSRKWALTIVLLLVVILLAAFGRLVAPPFIEQLAEIWKRTVDVIENLFEQLGEIGWAHGATDSNGSENQFASAAGTVAGHVANFTMMLVGAAASLFILVAIAVFTAFDPAMYRHGLLRLFPSEHRERLDRTLSMTAYALRWWFLGQLISMLVLGVTVSVGLLLIGVELWLGLGVLTALLTFVPFIGPIIAGVPIVILGFGEGTEVGLTVLVFYLVVQTLESNVLMPIIQQRAVRLAPALLIAVQVLMSALFGVMGLIIAAPLTVVVLVAVKKLYLEAVLGQETEV